VCAEVEKTRSESKQHIYDFLWIGRRSEDVRQRTGKTGSETEDVREYIPKMKLGMKMFDKILIILKLYTL
jgi:hypothetical protein